MAGTKIVLKIILFLLLTSLIGCEREYNKKYETVGTEVITSAESPSAALSEKVYLKSLEEFKGSLSDKNTDALRAVIDQSGVTIIRNFYSGNGARGEDIRNVYSADEIPSDLQFEVLGETPVKLCDMFTALQQADIFEISIKNSDINFNFDEDEPSASDIIDMCCDIAGETPDRPMIYELGDNEIALTESQLINYTPMGVWAIFKNTGGNYYLKAIIDLE